MNKIEVYRYTWSWFVTSILIGHSLYANLVFLYNVLVCDIINIDYFTLCNSNNNNNKLYKMLKSETLLKKWFWNMSFTKQCTCIVIMMSQLVTCTCVENKISLAVLIILIDILFG